MQFCFNASALHKNVRTCNYLRALPIIFLKERERFRLLQDALHNYDKKLSPSILSGKNEVTYRDTAYLKSVCLEFPCLCTAEETDIVNCKTINLYQKQY